MWFSTSSGRIELNITKNQAAIGYHSGQCDADVLELSQSSAISRQLKKIQPAVLRGELSEYGVWHDKDLTDHAQNLQRLLWLACGDIVDRN